METENTELEVDTSVGFGKLMDGKEDPIEETTEETKGKETEEVVEKATEETTEETEDLIPNTDDVDYDNEEETTEEEEEELTESIAIKRAKEEGRLRKELEAQLSERDVELETLRSQVKELEDKQTESKMSQADPMKDPEYKSLYDSVIEDVEDTLVDVTYNGKDSPILLVADYAIKYNATKGKTVGERKQAYSEMKEEIAKSFSGMSDQEWEDDLDGTKDRFIREADSLFNLAKNIAPDVTRLQEISDHIKNNADEHQLNQKVSTYKETKDAITANLDTIMAIDGETIESDPYSLESMAAKRAKSGKADKTIENVKDDIILAETGGRIYTPEERKILKSQGKTDEDITQIEKESAKASKRKRDQHNNLVLQARLMQSEYKKMAKRLSELEDKAKADKDDEEATEKLLDADSKKTTRKAEKLVGFAKFGKSY